MSMNKDANWTTPATAGPETGFGLSPLREVLGNGVTVLAKETRKTPAVTIGLAVRAGSAYDPPEAAGAAYLLSRLIDRGTARHTASEIADALETRGNTLSVNVNRHLFSLTSTCLSEDFEGLLAVLGEMLISPSVPAEEVRFRKGEVITALRQDADSPYVRALDAFLELVYGGDHPYGRPVKGSIESVERLERAQVIAFHARSFVPSAVTLVVVGDIEPRRAVAVASHVFGGWSGLPAPALTLSRPVRPPMRREHVIPMMNKAQADVAYGFVGIARQDPAYHACALMNTIFGQYAMGGRIGDRIREHQGLAYYASSTLDAGLVEGPLVIRAGVAAENVERAIRSIDEEVSRMRESGITDAELADSRQYLIGSMPRALETNAGIASFLQTSELFGLGLDYDVRLPVLLQQVTRADVEAAARRLLDPASATVVVAGPVSAGTER